MIDEDGFDCDLDGLDRPHDDWSEQDRVELTPAGQALLAPQTFSPLEPLAHHPFDAMDVLDERMRVASLRVDGPRVCSGAIDGRPWVPPSRGCRPKRHCAAGARGERLGASKPGEVIIPEPGTSWRLWLAWKLLRAVLWLVGSFPQEARPWKSS